MHRLMYSCEQVSKLSSRAMEEPLGLFDRSMLKFHLMMCKGCSNFAIHIEFLHRASHKVPEVLEKDAD